MKSLWKRIRIGLLVVLLGFGAVSSVSMIGCDDNDNPVEEAADEVEDAVDDATD